MNNYCTEMCSGSEAGSHFRLVDFVYHSTLGLRVIKKKKLGCYVRWSISVRKSAYGLLIATCLSVQGLGFRARVWG